MKLLVLVKFPTPIRTSNISLIKRFSLSSRAMVGICSDNVWESPDNAWFYACILSEAATRGVLYKKVFLEIWQNSQENTCAKVSTLLKRDSGTGVSCDFSKNTLFTEYLWTTASKERSSLSGSLSKRDIWKNYEISRKISTLENTFDKVTETFPN